MAKERHPSWRPPDRSVKKMSGSSAATRLTQEGSVGTPAPGVPWVRSDTRRLSPSARTMSATALYPAQLNLSGDSGCATDQNTGSSTPSAPSSRTARIPAAIAVALFTVAPSVTESMGRPTNSLAGARSSTSWLWLLCSPAPKKRPTRPAALRSLLTLQPPCRAGGNATLFGARAAPAPRVLCGRCVADAICVVILAGTVSMAIDQAVRGMAVRACASEGRTRSKREGACSGTLGGRLGCFCVPGEVFMGGGKRTGERERGGRGARVGSRRTRRGRA